MAAKDDEAPSSAEQETSPTTPQQLPTPAPAGGDDGAKKSTWQLPEGLEDHLEAGTFVYSLIHSFTHSLYSQMRTEPEEDLSFDPMSELKIEGRFTKIIM